MMLAHLGHLEATKVIENAIQVAIAGKKILTPDLGSRATTADMGNAIAEIVKLPAHRHSEAFS